MGIEEEEIREEYRGNYAGVCMNLLIEAISHGTLCGSRKHGWHTEESDYDYIIKYDHVKEYLDGQVLLKNKPYYRITPIVSFPVTVNPNRLISVGLIICTSNVSYDRYMQCEEAFLYIVESCPAARDALANKELRVMMYKALRNQFKIGDKDI